MFYIGTCGYSYKDWENIFYGNNEKNKLQKYFNFFDLVEIDSTFYTFPQEYFINYIKKNIINKKFNNKKFIFKINKYFTHEIFNNIRNVNKNKIFESIYNFFNPLLNIKENILLILFQFPYSVKFDENFLSNFIIILEGIKNFLIKTNSSYFFSFSIEIRNKTFLNDEFFEFLKKNKIVFVNIDQPIISNSIPLTFIKTSENFLYFRLHGRNYENWFNDNKEPYERYNYLYKPEEIIEIGNEILNNFKDYLLQTNNDSNKNFIITMNNHYKAKSILNAFEFLLYFNKKIFNKNFLPNIFNFTNENNLFNENNFLLSNYKEEINNFLNMIEKIN